MAKKEFYARLGIPETASDKEIQDAYQRLIADCDPSSEQYSDLTEAYNILSDLEKRAYYDIRGKKPSVKRRKGSDIGHSAKIEKIRFILNSIFMIGAIITAILFILYLSDKNPNPFYWACSISLTIKVIEYILRLVP
jgi:DnaJ-class molecular chaperone